MQEQLQGDKGRIWALGRRQQMGRAEGSQKGQEVMEMGGEGGTVEKDDLKRMKNERQKRRESLNIVNGKFGQRGAISFRELVVY